MKQNNIYLFIVTIFLFQFFTVNAQNIETNCRKSIKNMISLLENENYTKKDSSKAIKELKLCVKKENSNAQLLLGRLYLKKQNEKSFSKGFKLIKKAAKQNHSAAMYDLATLYKYGKGCNLNFEKAEKWFRKSANLGNEKAMYSIGYMYYKGLGTINQDYKKAVYWFEKSDSQMAKYWLGVCYYYGYGVDRDIQKSFSYFKSSGFIQEKEFNEISKNIKNDLNQQENDSIKKDTIFSDDLITTVELTEEKIYGKWRGKLLILDWSGNNIEQTIPISIQFKKGKTEEFLETIWEFEDKEYISSSIFNYGVLYFEDLFLPLEKKSFIKSINKELVYQFLSSSFELKTVSDKTYLTGTIESFIDRWKEPGTPIQLILLRESVFTDNNQEISEEILQILSNQKDNFIKLYPNPFQNDLIIAYTLEKDSFIQISITSFNNSTSTIIEQGKNQKGGDHSYFFDGRSLPKGMYIITIIIDGSKKTKLIIKE